MKRVITDKEISEYFGNTPKTLSIWKNSDNKKNTERYEAFKQRVLMIMNGFESVVLLIEKNKELELRFKELKDYCDEKKATKKTAV